MLLIIEAPAAHKNRAMDFSIAPKLIIFKFHDEAQKCEWHDSYSPGLLALA